MVRSLPMYESTTRIECINEWGLYIQKAAAIACIVIGYYPVRMQQSLCGHSVAFTLHSTFSPSVLLWKLLLRALTTADLLSHGEAGVNVLLESKSLTATAIFTRSDTI